MSSMSTDGSRPAIPAELERMLARLRQRIRLYVVIEGSAMLLVLLAVVFWLSLGLDWAWFRVSRLELPVWFRVMIDLGALSVAAAAAMSWIGLRWWRRFRARGLALVLERRFPELDDRLITAVEMADTFESAETPLERIMLERTFRDVVEVSRQLDVGDVFQKRPLRRSVVLAVALVVSIGGLAVADSTVLSRWADGYLALKEEYWPREYGLFVSVDRGPGRPPASFDRQNVYRHPRGEDLVLTIEVRPDPSRKQVEPLERVEVDYRQSDGAGRVVCAQTGPHQFRHSRAGLLENMTFRVRGGDYVNRRPFRVEVVDPPEMEQVVLDCHYAPYTRLNVPGSSKQRTRVAVQGTQVDLPMETDVLLQARTNKPFVGMQVEFDQYRLSVSLAEDGSVQAWLEAESSEGEQVRRRPIDLAALGLAQKQPLPARVFRLPLVISSSAGRDLPEVFSGTAGSADPFPGPIPVPANVQLRFAIHDTDDIISRDPALLTINGVVDQPPVIETVLRGIGTEVTRIARIPVAGLIRDDYGVADVHFEFQVLEAGQRVDDLPGTWQKRPLVLGPQDAPLEFSLVTAADDVPRDAALKTPENQKAVWFDLRQLNPEPTVGQKLVLSIVATDADDKNGPHSTRSSPHYVFSIVSNEDLQFALMQKELNLRRRFEQVISEVERTQQDVARHRGQVEQRKKQADYSATEIEEAVKQIDVAVANCAERSINEISKSHNETSAIAQEFIEIREELINNGVHTPQALERIDAGILSPLHRINAEDYTGVETALRAFARTNRASADPSAEMDAALDGLRSLLARMKLVLKEMQRLETFQEALKLLRQIIGDEEKLLEKTKEERKRDLIKKLNGLPPGSKSDPDEKSNKKKS